MKYSTIVIIVYFALTGHVYAYLDPGTGSAIIQLVLFVVASVGAFMSLYWRKIKNFSIKIFKKDKKEKKD